MKRFALLTAAALIGISAFAPVASADGLIPGLYYFKAEEAATRSAVAAGTISADATATGIGATVSFGMPRQKEIWSLVPGSERGFDAAEVAARASVVRGF